MTPRAHQITRPNALADCQICFLCFSTADPGHLWTFNYFFYNKKSKRIVYFSCRSKSKASLESSGSESDMADDVDEFEDPFLEGMDM